jgi:hypothetical protein
MSNTVNTSNWYTKQEAARVLQVSEKTIDRMVEREQLGRDYRRIPGQTPVPIFKPADLKKLAAERGINVDTKPETSIVKVNGALEPDAHLTSQALQQTATAAPELPLSELRHKVYLTTDEAVRYSGLSVDYLSELVRQGKLARLEALRPYRYKRVDLEGL